MASKWKMAASAGSAARYQETETSPGGSMSSPQSTKPRRMKEATGFFSSFSPKSRPESAYRDTRQEDREKEFMMADDPTMRARWDVVDLRTLSMVICFGSILVAGAIPLAEQFIWYKHDARLTEITVVNWVVAGVAGLLGLAAAFSKNSNLVAFHVIIGGMLGAALGLYSVMVYYDMRVRCEIMQAAYVGCSGCTCSLQNRCTKEDLLQEECALCAAWPVEVCSSVSAFSLTSIMGLVAVLAASVPACVNLILLLRMEAQVGEAFKTMKGLDTAELEHQMELLAVGAEPTARPTSINLLIDRVRDHGDTTLAEKARAALNVYKAVRRGPPENKVTLKSLAQRAQGPKLLNVASLVRRQGAAAEYEVPSELGGSTADSEQISKQPSFAASAAAGSQRGGPGPVSRSGSRASSAISGPDLRASSAAEPDDRPSSAPANAAKKSGGLLGILNKKRGHHGAAASSPPVSSAVQEVSIGIDSDDDEEELSPVDYGPSHVRRDLQMSRFIDPEDETGFNKQLVSTFELDES